MSKLIRIILIILLAFALASLLIFRLRIGDAPAGPTPAAINSDVQTAEGQIGIVDTDTKTVTLVDGDKQVTFDFDERTAIVESGHAVLPAKIPQGAAASVRYTQRGGKNWARKIELLTDTPGESY
jgi:Cu/Ag efflux protein CusF